MNTAESDTPQALPPKQAGEWSQFTRQAAIVVLLLGILLLVSVLRPLLNLLGITGIFILILSYPVNSLRARTRLPYAAAVVLIFVPLGILLFILFGNLLQWFLAAAESMISSLETTVSASQYASILMAWLNRIFQDSGTVLLTLAAQIADKLGLVTQIITLTGISFFLAFLFILEMPANLARSFQTLSDVSQREFGILLDRLSGVWNGWLRSTVITSIIIGLAAAVELYLFGIPYAGVLGVVTGLLNLIPTFGPLVSYLLIIFVTFTEGSSKLTLNPTALTILVFIVNLVVNQFVRLVIFPRLASKAIRLPAFLVIFGLLTAAVLWGVVGVILVIPLLGTAKEILGYVLRKINRQDPYPGEQPHTGFWVQEISAKKSG